MPENVNAEIARDLLSMERPNSASVYALLYIGDQIGRLADQKHEPPQPEMPSLYRDIDHDSESVVITHMNGKSPSSPWLSVGLIVPRRVAKLASVRFADLYGGSLSRSAYPELFAMIGERFGTVDGDPDQFRLPDFRAGTVAP